MSSDFNWYLFLPKNGWRKIVGSKITRWATSIKKKRLIANFMSQGSQKKNRLYPVHRTPIFVGLEEVSVGSLIPVIF